MGNLAAGTPLMSDSLHSFDGGLAMTAPKELEIKLEVAPASVATLKKIPLIRRIKKQPRSTTEVSVYFDTEKQKLRKKGLLLRVRRIGNRHIQTKPETPFANCLLALANTFGCELKQFGTLSTGEISL